MRIAIIGSRGYAHPEEVIDYVDSLDLSVIVVSGECKDGPDKIAEDRAKDRGMTFEGYPADWTKGKGAGFVRNGDIAKACDRLKAFWDGESNGTMDTIKKALKLKKPVSISVSMNK